MASRSERASSSGAGGRVDTPAIAVGVVGTGYVARHFVQAWDGRQGLEVAAVLTRRRHARV